MAELNSTPEKQGGKVRSKKQSTRVDLTAMVDLAFLLITFFMLTTTLSKSKAMDVAMPVGDVPGGERESRTLTICLGADNKAMYYLGLADQPLVAPTITDYGKNGLRHAIMEMRQKVYKSTGKPMMAIIKPSQKSVFGNLVNTLDEMKITDVQQFAIADIAAVDVNLLKDKHVY